MRTKLARHRRHVIGAALLAALCGGSAGATVVVVSSDVPGLDAGSVLVGWRVLDDGGALLHEGRIDHPLALVAARREFSALGDFRLVHADGATTTEPLPFGGTLLVRPDLDPELLALYRGGSEADERARDLRTLGQLLERAGHLEQAAWAFGGAGFSAESVEAARGAFAKARDLVTESPLLLSILLELEENALERLGEPVDPVRRQLLESALAQARAHDPHGQAVAAAMIDLADLDLYGGDPERAEALFNEALAMREAAHPESLHTAEILTRLAVVTVTLGRLAESVELARRRLELLERIDAPPLQMVRGHRDLGDRLWKLGKLAEAQEQLETASRLAEVTTGLPAGLVAVHEISLANLLFDLADFVAAEEHARRAVAIAEAETLPPVHLPNFLNTLATIQNERYDHDAADATLERAIALYEQRLGPSSRNLAMALNNRANNAQLAGDPQRALVYVERAAAMIEEVAPDSLTATNSQTIRSEILRKLGDLEGAIEEMRHSVEAMRREFAGSHQLARKATQLGRFLEEAGKPEEARSFLAEAHQIYRGSGLDDRHHARAIFGLGLVEATEGREDTATERFCEAVAMIDGHRRGIGVDRDDGDFARNYAHYYHRCSEGLAAQDRLEEALEVVEQSRARDLLQLMAQRRLSLDERIPADLLERREDLNRRYDELYGRRLGGEEEPTADSELQELRRGQRELERAIRSRAPRAAAVQIPERLAFQEIVGSLEPDTLLLAYSVGEESSRLYVVGGAVGTRQIESHPIDVPRAELERLVGDLVRSLVEGGAYREPARRLWDLLLTPAEPSISRARRLFLSPDGALHLLPFAALLDERDRFLVERLPIHQAVSATVRDDLQRRPAPSRPLVAFGDPVLAGDPSYRVATAVRSGLGLGPLPAARREVRSIAGLFPGAAESWLGEQATQTRFEERAPGAGRIHVATHGWLDDASPLDSGLIFSPESKDDEGRNGILQAWEILEQLELDADLVTLSACESGLGRRAGGEGIIGLTRALQIAGARSVVASLWKVDDESTAELMVAFYRGLREGLPKDEALRAAQLSLLRSGDDANAQRDQDSTPRTGATGGQRAVGGLAVTRRVDVRHPYHWAAFQLLGARR